MLAIISAVELWELYLLGRHFIIRIDYQSLRYFLEQQIATLAQYRWLSKLLGYDYEIQYKKEHENSAIDALSRRDIGLVELMVVSFPTCSFLDDIGTNYFQDEELQKLKS